MKKSRLILTVLTAAWAILIFCFSAQNGEQSSRTSGRFVTAVLRILEPEYDSLEPEHQQALRETLTFVIRKTAHFSEYLIFGGLLWGWYLTFAPGEFGTDFGIRRLIFRPWLTGSIYAATDELHQMFSDGRSPQLTDVGIDAWGVLCGVLLCLSVYLLIRHRRTYDKSRRRL